MSSAWSWCPECKKFVDMNETDPCDLCGTVICGDCEQPVDEYNGDQYVSFCVECYAKITKEQECESSAP